MVATETYTLESISKGPGSRPGGGLETDRKHLVELLDWSAHNHRFGLHAAHQELQVLLKGLLVLDEAHGHIVVGATALQLLQEAATKGTVLAPPTINQLQARSSRRRPGSLSGSEPPEGEYVESRVQEVRGCVPICPHMSMDIYYVCTCTKAFMCGCILRQVF